MLSGAFCWTGFIRIVGAWVATKCVRGVAFARIGVCIGPGAWLWRKRVACTGGVYCADMPGCSRMCPGALAWEGCSVCALSGALLDGFIRTVGGLGGHEVCEGC